MAIVIVLISVFAPVFAGVVPALGPSDSARAVIIFVSLFRVGERETDVEQHSTSTAKFSDRRSDGPQRGRCPRQLHGASGSGFGRPGGSERTGVLAGDNGCDTDFNRQDRSTPESGALEDRSGPAVGRTERGQRMVVR